MTARLSSDVLQDDIAVAIARAIAAANKRARELNIDVMQSIISLTQHPQNDSWVWRVNYGARDYIGRRGGDLIIEVNPEDISIQRVLWGQ
ncbi:hypothetical protein [Microcoleus sp. herbarium12]|uniref:hypothetical protein n=1 Tax=Microcoleus sp. herbarium12 TaxID=3055437 RepID=UPI002FD3D1D2